MVSIGAIVAISSAYFGIFSATNLLSNLKRWVLDLACRSNVFFVTVVVSFITCAISCNQTLATMLTCEMTKTLTEKKETLAVNLEMSVIVIAGLLPWSIACAFPLSVVEAPKESLIFAVYLYMVPLWMVLFLKTQQIICLSVKGAFPYGMCLFDVSFFIYQHSDMDAALCLYIYIVSPS